MFLCAFNLFGKLLQRVLLNLDGIPSKFFFHRCWRGQTPTFGDSLVVKFLRLVRICWRLFWNFAACFVAFRKCFHQQLYFWRRRIFGTFAYFAANGLGTKALLSYALRCGWTGNDCLYSNSNKFVEWMSFLFFSQSPRLKNGCKRY